MISKSQIQLLTSLQYKKYRNEHGLFIVEGEKIARSLLLSSYKTVSVYATTDWLQRNLIIAPPIKTYEVSQDEMERISGLKTPQNVLIVAEMPIDNLNINDLKEGLTLVLDEIKDPGNLGTIIRIADWFGIKNIVCSPESVDVYNPKVIQATMGSFCNVNVGYFPLDDLFSNNETITVFGTALDGENVYDSELTKDAFIVFGNESRGINPDLMKFIDKKIMIPSYNKNPQKAESLNISIAAGIICSEFRRRGF